MGMKSLTKLLKNKRAICFLDFEGSQFSHEMIAFGAVFATIDSKGKIKRVKKPIKYYVKAKNKIGKFVENLTGITQADLDKLGIPFSKALKEIKKYCGIAYSHTAFMTFGNHDIRILNQSVSYNLDAPVDISKVIQKNYIDFQNVIFEFIRDDNNNPYSLANYLKVFNVDFDGTEHDPQADAVNLMNLYRSFYEKEDIVLKEYLKTLGHLNHLPKPAKEALKRLAEGGNVSASDFQQFAKEYLDD